MPETLKDNFPGNSRNPKPPQPEELEIVEPRTEKIISGTVKQKKRGFGKKFAETFLEDDTKTVGSYIFWDVVIPGVKHMISELIGGGIDMLLFGERRRGGAQTHRVNGRSYVNYGSYSRERNYERDKRDVRDRDRSNRARHDFDDIVFETRGEAEYVLSHLSDLIIEYHMASVSDLYGLVGITPNFTDDRWGWTDMRGAHVSRIRGEYVLNMPKTVPLN